MTHHQLGFMGFGRVVLFAAPLALLVACGGATDAGTNSDGSGDNVAGANSAGSVGTNVGTAGAPGGAGSDETTTGTAGASGGLGGADNGGSAGTVGGAGGSVTVLPPFSTPAAVENVNELSHGCQDSELGNVVISITNLTKDAASPKVPALSACEPQRVGPPVGNDWWWLADKEPTYLSFPITHDWVGLLTVAFGGEYDDTIAVQLFEDQYGFLSAVCNSETKGSVVSNLVGGAPPQPEPVLCGSQSSDLYGGLGTFKARLVSGAPTITFYPQDGSAAVPMTVIEL